MAEEKKRRLGGAAAKLERRLPPELKRELDRRWRANHGGGQRECQVLHGISPLTCAEVR